MKTLFILNGPPYGTEHSYNGLRLAGALAKRDGENVRIFLMGDAVGCALQGQVLPDGYYHLDRMLGSAIRRGAEVGCCGTCMDARAVDDALRGFKTRFRFSMSAAAGSGSISACFFPSCISRS